jgi:predicted butyrate kinase (DUF1464 family)
MNEKKEPDIPLGTIPEIVHAHEWLFNRQKDGKIDAKTADGLNTTLKGIVYLKAKLAMDAQKLYVMAQVKKIEIPSKFLLPMG